MKVHITIEIGDKARRAIARRDGQKGLATRAHIRGLVEKMLQAEIDDATDELLGRDLRTAVTGR